jgi:hypothetical protein
VDAAASRSPSTRALPLWAWLVRRVGGPFVRSELRCSPPRGGERGVEGARARRRPRRHAGLAAGAGVAAGVRRPLRDRHGARRGLRGGVERLGVPSWAPWLLAAAASRSCRRSCRDRASRRSRSGATSCAGSSAPLVLVPAIWGARARCPRYCGQPVAAVAGAISYGIYLWQLPVILELQQRDGWRRRARRRWQWRGGAVTVGWRRRAGTRSSARSCGGRRVAAPAASRGGRSARPRGGSMSRARRRPRLLLAGPCVLAVLLGRLLRRGRACGPACARGRSSAWGR